MPAGLGLYGLARSGTLEHMSERPPWQQPTWPQNCPHPGDPAWPDGAIRWLHDHIPDNQWRHRALRQHPYWLTLAAATTVRTQLEALRTQYTETATRWSAFLPAETVRQLLDDTAREGERLKVLLGEVAALEQALFPEVRGPRDGGTGGSVTPGP